MQERSQHRIKETGYYRHGQPKVGMKLSSPSVGGGRTTIMTAKIIGDITPGGVSVVEIRVLDRIRTACRPMIRAGDFTVTDPKEAKSFVRAITEGCLEAEENDRLAEGVAARAEQIVAVTGCTDQRAVRQAIKELFNVEDY